MNKNCNFTEFSEYWLNKQEKLKSIKESSLSNFCLITKKHLQPVFGQKKLKEISEQDLQNAVSFWLSHGNLKTQQGLSIKTVKDYVGVFKLIMTEAKKKKYIKEQDFSVIYPRENSVKVMEILTETEQRELVQAVYLNLSCKSLGILLSLFLGLRIGEVCALKWNDINFENKVVTITKTRQRIYKMGEETYTKLLTGTPKSQSSVRTIPIPTMLLNIMLKLKPNNLDYYILTNKIKPTEPRTYRSWFCGFLGKHDLRKIKFHSLRHTFAARAMQTTGFDLYSLSSLLGHKNTSTTLDFYGGSNLEQKKVCMELLNRFL